MMMNIIINNKLYKVKIAETEEEREKGLQGIENLLEDEGMLFIFEEPQTVGMWMKDTLIPLDIIFINEDQMGSCRIETEEYENLLRNMKNLTPSAARLSLSTTWQRESVSRAR